MAAHLDVALSSYLDGALAPQERAAVEAHLQGCAVCRAELEALRGVQRLLAQLPERAPRHSLLPRRQVPGWLAPARWLSTAAAAVFAVVFVVSSVPGAPLTTGRDLAQPAAAPQSEESRDTAAKAAPAPASPPQGAFQVTSASPSPSPSPRASAQPRASISSDRASEAQRPVGPPPAWWWLVAALVAGALALVLQMRITRRL